MAVQLRLALGNKPFARLILAKLLLLLAMSSYTTSMFYFVTHILQKELSVVSEIGLLQTTGMLCSLPVWVRVARRWAKHKLFAAACAANAAVFLTWLLAGAAEPNWMLLLRAFVIGWTSGGALLMGQALLPDTMEYDYRRSGLRREGAFSGAYSMVEKAGFAFGPLRVGMLLASAGYNGAASHANATAGTSFAIYLGVSIIPAAATALSVLVLLGYDLTEQRLKDMVVPEPSAVA
jgi:GPH family glycoside/pentoside/hexuronide:cation symporter